MKLDAVKLNVVMGALAALSIGWSGAALAQSDKDVRADEAARGYTGVVPLDRARARADRAREDRTGERRVPPPPQAQIQPQPRVDNRDPRYGDRDRDGGRRYDGRAPVYVERAPVYVERGNPRFEERGHRDGGWRDRDGGGWREGRYGERYDRDGRRWGAGPEHRFYRGERLPIEYRNRYYVVDDWRDHRLSAPPRGHQWVQTGSDYVLIAIATGIIASIILSQ